MAKYKDFLQSFQNKLPDFLKDKNQEIASDIIAEIQKGINNGVEFRGYFSIVKRKMAARHSIIFRNLANLKNPDQK